MLNAENIKDAEQRRLAWRCRRGMLELDIVLQAFIAEFFDQLSMAELHAFDELLSMPDNELWQVLGMKNLRVKNEHQQSIIKKLSQLYAVNH